MRCVPYILSLFILVGLKSAASAQESPRLELVLTTKPSAFPGLSVSSDGKKIVTGPHDRENAILWDVAEGKSARIFQGHSSEVTSTALSADGKYVVTGSLDKTAILWDAVSGKKLQTFEHSRGITCVNGNGKYVVTGSYYDKTVIVWDAATGKKLHAHEYTRGVQSVVLSADGKHVAISDNVVNLRDMASGKPIKTFHSGRSEVPVVRAFLSGNGKRIVTNDGGPLAFRNATVWDVASAERISSFDQSRTAVLSFDGKLIVTGEFTQAILREVDSEKGIKTFKHTSPVIHVSLSDDGKHLWTASGASGSEQRCDAARLWDTGTGKERCCLYTFGEGKEWLVVTPEGFFDGSEPAFRFVAYRESGTKKLLEDEATRKRFHRPGLLAQVWKG